MIHMNREDAYGLGLLYSYHAGNFMVLKRDLDAFWSEILKNLIEAGETNESRLWDDIDADVYYPCFNENGEECYALCPNFDYDYAMSKYVGCVSLSFIKASQKENALQCFGLQEVDGKIKRLAL